MKRYLLPTLLCLLAISAGAFAQSSASGKEAKTVVAIQDPFQKLFDQGMAHLEEDEFAKAAQFFQRALKINSKNAEAHYRLGSCYYELALYIDAVNSYREAVRIMPNYYDAIVYLGNALDYDGQFASAVEMYKKAIQLKPDEWQPHYELGIAQYNQKMYDEAILSFQESRKLAEKITNTENRNSTVSRANYYLGDSFRMSRRYAEAVKAYQETLRLDAENEMAYYGLGLAFVGQSNATAARQQYDKLRQMNPNLAAQLLQEINKIQLAA